MLTVYHSEALAVWALRARVWDYFVKPFAAEDILRSAISLFRLRHKQERSAARKVISPMQDVLPLDNPNSRQKTVLKAQAYILEHLNGVRLKDVADYCGMSPNHFSRVFTQTSKTNFKEFLRRTRIRKAVEMLSDPSVTVQTVCYAVGFNDLSYFGRTFRRYVGMAPSSYRSTVLNSTHPVSQLYAQFAMDRLDLQ
jgi:AraC-like DNA-binding protein